MTRKLSVCTVNVFLQKVTFPSDKTRITSARILYARSHVFKKFRHMQTNKKRKPLNVDFVTKYALLVDSRKRFA